MDVFAAAMDVLATDPSWSVAGTFTPRGGTPQAVALVSSPRDPTAAAFGSLGMQSGTPGRHFVVRVAEVPTRPREGDLVTDGTESFRVQKAELAYRGTAWRLTCVRV